jgi:hypothetical protein
VALSHATAVGCSGRLFTTWEARPVAVNCLPSKTMKMGRLRSSNLGCTAAVIPPSRPDGVIYRQQYVRCGKPGCHRCPPTGPGHGPYWFGYLLGPKVTM